MSDVNEDISLLEALKDGKYEASLITTFNATLPFYEEVVLRRLRASGSTHNVVLMDSAQCARSWATPSLRPRLAGSLYTLIPIVAPGSFHPKICLLASRKRCVLFVGSHNVTLSGFGFNREVTTRVDVGEGSNPAHRLVLSHAWSLIREWLRTQENTLAPSVIKAALRIEKLIPVSDGTVSLPSDIRLLGQSVEGPSLLDQLQQAIPFAPARVVVTGAFFDTRHAFLKSIEELWPDAMIRVVIDPTTVKLGARPSGLRSRFVNARALWPDKAHLYLHAKALLLDFNGSQTLVAGSANPSGPAWLSGNRRNFEAMFVQPEIAPGSSTFASDLAQAFSARTMNEADLRAIAISHQDNENDSGERAVPVLVAALAAGSTSIVIPALAMEGLSKFVMYLADGTTEERTPTGRTSNHDAAIDLGSNAVAVRWIELSSRGERRLRIIIHHESLLGNSTTSPNRSRLRDALVGLDFSAANIETLVADIEKAIFEDPEQVIASTARTGSLAMASQHLEMNSSASPPSSTRPTACAASARRRASWRTRFLERCLSSCLETQSLTRKAGQPSAWMSWGL